jgi:hypothetical protein
LAWVAEIWTQAPARLPATLERPVPAVFALVAATVTVAAGLIEGARSGDGRCALTVGLWTGLFSGAILTVGLIAIQLSNLELLGARADYQRELARSGSSDMATYLAGDAIAASLMHMLIGVVLGLIGAGIGAAIAGGHRKAQPDPEADLL